MKARYILVLLLLPLLTQCSARRVAVADDAMLSPAKEQTWQLVEQRGKEVAVRTAKIILMFHPETGTLRGQVACNRYTADYVLQPLNVDAAGTHYALTVANVSGGDVQCPEGGMAAQERYLALLGQADACLLTPYTLTLFRCDKEILKYELQ